MSALVAQITGVSVVCKTVCSGADQRKHQSTASLAIVKGIHRWPVDSPHKGPVTAEKVSIRWRHHDEIIYNKYIVDIMNSDDTGVNEPIVKCSRLAVIQFMSFIFFQLQISPTQTLKQRRFMVKITRRQKQSATAWLNRYTNYENSNK